MAPGITYALEELLTAARVPHQVRITDTRAGWDLLYSDRPPPEEVLWMAASAAAARFFTHPGSLMRCTRTEVVAGQQVRLPVWDEEPGARIEAPSCPPPRPHALPDLAAAAFFFLSRWEEWQSAERDRFGRYPLSASVFGRGLWSLTECPVEAYARALRRALEAAPRTTWLTQTDDYGTGDLGITEPGSFTVGLSHDVDTIRRWDTRGFVRTGRSAGRSLAAGHLRAALRESAAFTGGMWSRLVGRDPHWNVQAAVDLERALGTRSTFFLLSRHTHPWDGAHPAHYQRLLPALTRTARRGAEVGLHASTAATGAAELQLERTRLEELVDGPIRGVRFHNLRGGYGALSEVASAGMEYDSSMGFAEEPGFCTGLARPFRPFDRERNRPLDLVEIPLALMDTTLLSSRYLGLGVAAGQERALAVLEAIRRWRGAAALLWHNDNLPPNVAEGYADLYVELVDWIVKSGGRVCSLAEIVDDWRQSCRELRPGTA